MRFLKNDFKLVKIFFEDVFIKFKKEENFYENIDLKKKRISLLTINWRYAVSIETILDLYYSEFDSKKFHQEALSNKFIITKEFISIKPPEDFQIQAWKALEEKKNLIINVAPGSSLSFFKKFIFKLIIIII